MQGGLGGGLKVGFFPAFTGQFVGLEAGLSGLDGKVNAPTATTGGVTRSANFRLQSVNAMANLLLRYPGEIIQPYVGVGSVYQEGFARDLDLQHSSVGVVRENAADGAFALPVHRRAARQCGERMFLFTEYKYFVANYQWESELADGSTAHHLRSIIERIWWPVGLGFISNPGRLAWFASSVRPYRLSSPMPMLHATPPPACRGGPREAWE